MISGIFFFSLRGELFLSRLYRADLPRGIAEAFRLEIVGKKPGRLPLRVVNGVSYFFIRHNDLWIVATSRKNANAALAFELLHRIVSLFSSYFENSLFDQNVLKNNYVLLFELLDEIVDYGYPQILDSDILKMYIKTDDEKARLSRRRHKDDAEESSKITIQATGARSWRREGLKYRKNEIWIDIIESVNLLLSQKGDALRKDVDAKVMVRSKLSGMPECQFGFNDKFTMRSSQSRDRARKDSAINVDDIQFHQCVKLSQYGQDRSITFTPPDIDFELMRYRSTEGILLPFRVIPIVNEVSGGQSVEAKVTVKSLFSQKGWANSVVITIPVPSNTAKPHIRTTHGKAKYQPELNAILWRIRRFPGRAECSLACRADLIKTSTHKVWRRPPITMTFSVPMFTASGLKVTFLRVLENKSRYQAQKWVRYLTKAGSYQIRI